MIELFAEELMSILLGGDTSFIDEVLNVRSFDEMEMLTKDVGLVIDLKGGHKITLIIK